MFKETDEKISAFLKEGVNAPRWIIFGLAMGILFLLLLLVGFADREASVKYVQICGDEDNSYTSEGMTISQFLDSLTKIENNFWTWALIIIIGILILK